MSHRKSRDCKILYVISLLRKYPDGISRKEVIEICKKNGINPIRIWGKLRKEGKIKRLGYNVFVLDEEKVTKSSAEPTINVHALQLAFPIIKDESKPEFWDHINRNFNNWSPCYKRVKAPIGFTIQKNTKQVQVQVWSRDVDKPEDIESLALRAAVYAAHYLKKNGVLVDLFQVEKKNIDIAIKDTLLKTIIPEKNKITIGLGRPAKPFFESDNSDEAIAMYDSSPFSAVETNDITYAERYLRTPEMVTIIWETLEKHSNNIELHLDVLSKQNQAQEQMKETMKMIQKAVEELCNEIRKYRNAAT